MDFFSLLPIRWWGKKQSIESQNYISACVFNNLNLRLLPVKRICPNSQSHPLACPSRAQALPKFKSLVVYKLVTEPLKNLLSFALSEMK